MFKQVSRFTGSPRAEQPLDRDVVFEVLSNQRRRYTFHYLKRLGGTAALDDLADQVTAWEYGKSHDDVAPHERKRVATALQQFHLPKMEEQGFVTYDPETKYVSLTEPATNVTVYLDVVPGKDVPWGLYYLTLSAVATALLVAGRLGLVALGVAWGETLATFVVATLGVSALVHTYYTHARLKLGTGESPPEVEEP